MKQVDHLLECRDQVYGLTSMLAGGHDFCLHDKLMHASAFVVNGHRRTRKVLLSKCKCELAVLETDVVDAVTAMSSILVPCPTFLLGGQM